MAAGYPAIWSNIVLHVSVRVFWDNTNIEIGRPCKAEFPP